MVRLRVAVCVLLSAKPPHPAAACTVKVTGVAEAVPPVSELTLSQAGLDGTLEERMVNGVPPAAVEVTETVEVVLLV